jgi:hypothetical protein
LNILSPSAQMATVSRYDVVSLNFVVSTRMKCACVSDPLFYDFLVQMTYKHCHSGGVDINNAQHSHQGSLMFAS